MSNVDNVTAYAGTALEAAVKDAARAAWGDSNDDELEALRDALDEALLLLGLNFETLAGDALNEEDDES